jgi:hypothetical protein
MTVELRPITSDSMAIINEIGSSEAGFLEDDELVLKYREEDGKRYKSGVIQGFNIQKIMGEVYALNVHVISQGISSHESFIFSNLKVLVISEQDVLVNKVLKVSLKFLGTRTFTSKPTEQENIDVTLSISYGYGIPVCHMNSIKSRMKIELIEK